MKKLTLVSSVITATLLVGCTTTPVQNKYTGESVSVKTENAYDMAVSCALEHITTPVSGNFFAYQSDKLEKYSLVFSMPPVSSSTFTMTYTHNRRATLQASVKDGELTYKITNVVVKSDSFEALGGTSNQGSWSPNAEQEVSDANRRDFGAMVHSLVQCAKG